MCGVCGVCGVWCVVCGVGCGVWGVSVGCGANQDDCKRRRDRPPLQRAAARGWGGFSKYRPMKYISV